MVFVVVISICLVVADNCVQRGVVQHQAVQAPGAGVDRVQEGPALPSLLGLVVYEGMYGVKKGLSWGILRDLLTCLYVRACSNRITVVS